MTPSAALPVWTQSSSELLHGLDASGVAELMPGEVGAIDGKTARRSYDPGSKRAPLHLVSAWTPTRNTLTLGLKGQDGGEVQ